MKQKLMTRENKVNDLTKKLTEGIKTLYDSERYRVYLRTLSKFHKYSYNNVMLILMQKPDATFVAGYKQWQTDFGRYVKSGEKSINILAPMFFKKKKDNGEEYMVVLYRTVSVFDISQTAGKPIDLMQPKLLTHDVDGYTDIYCALEKVSPVPVKFKEITTGANGYYSRLDNSITIKKNMGQLQTVKTLTHEIAHATLHQDPNCGTRNDKEVEAESIAYVVCNYFGLDTSEYSFNYIAGWSSGKELKELQKSLEIIQKTANFIIQSIESQLASIG